METRFEKQQRAEALREAIKGEGISGGMSGLKEFLGFFAREGFSPERFADTLTELLPDNHDHIEAALNALVGRDGLNLTKRREEFLGDKNMSYRTLMRHEQEGIELIVKYMDIADDQLQRARELAHEEDEARDVDIAVLRGRIARLEVIVGRLFESLVESHHGLSMLGVYSEPDVKTNIDGFRRELMEAVDEHGDRLIKHVKDMPARKDVKFTVKDED